MPAKLKFAAAAVLCGIVAAIMYATPREPSAHGRTLQQWITTASEQPAEMKPKAKAAIAEMGAEAIPTLFNWIEYQPILERNRYARLIADRVPLARRLLSRDRYERLRGELPWVFAALGTAGTNALPRLVELANTPLDTPGPWIAAAALATMQPLSAREVALTVSNSNPLIRIRMLGAHYGQLNDPVPELIKALNHPDALVRYQAASRLGYAGKNKEIVVVPALTRFLTNSDPKGALWGLRALSTLGPGATSALPAITIYLDYPDRSVRLEATNAIHSINGVRRPGRRA